MKKLFTAVLLVIISFNVMAEDSPPLYLDGFGVDSVQYPGKQDTVLVVTSTSDDLIIKDIIVNGGACVPYSKVPANFLVKSGISFQLTFHGLNNQSCRATKIIVDTNDGAWEF